MAALTKEEDPNHNHRPVLLEERLLLHNDDFATRVHRQLKRKTVTIKPSPPGLQQGRRDLPLSLAWAPWE